MEPEDHHNLHNQIAQKLQKENPEKYAEAATKAKVTRDQEKRDVEGWVGWDSINNLEVIIYPISLPY